uniref:Hydrolase n=1 Tax=uncultured marine virus TaxID=186617 RepID=A0A0F7LAB7_9VIRU|nr:hydrolase [uncultured marine virus]
MRVDQIAELGDAHSIVRSLHCLRNQQGRVEPGGDHPAEPFLGGNEQRKPPPIRPRHVAEIRLSRVMQQAFQDAPVRALCRHPDRMLGDRDRRAVLCPVGRPVPTYRPGQLVSDVDNVDLLGIRVERVERLAGKRHHVMSQSSFSSIVVRVARPTSRAARGSENLLRSLCQLTRFPSPR